MQQINFTKVLFGGNGSSVANQGDGWKHFGGIIASNQVELDAIFNAAQGYQIYITSNILDLETVCITPSGKENALTLEEATQAAYWTIKTELERLSHDPLGTSFLKYFRNQETGEIEEFEEPEFFKMFGFKGVDCEDPSYWGVAPIEA
jgi:hypothetical protein